MIVSTHGLEALRVAEAFEEAHEDGQPERVGPDVVDMEAPVGAAASDTGRVLRQPGEPERPPLPALDERTTQFYPPRIMHDEPPPRHPVAVLPGPEEDELIRIVGQDLDEVLPGLHAYIMRAQSYCSGVGG